MLERHHSQRKSSQFGLHSQERLVWLWPFTLEVDGHHKGGVMDGWMTLLKDEEKHWVSLSESGLQSEGAICEEPEDCIHCRSEAVLALARCLAASRALVAEKETALRNLAKWVRDPANPNLLSLTRNTRAVLAL